MSEFLNKKTILNKYLLFMAFISPLTSSLKLNFTYLDDQNQKLDQKHIFLEILFNSKLILNLSFEYIISKTKCSYSAESRQFIDSNVSILLELMEE